jgi:(2Fe-2S) ferredoxin
MNLPYSRHILICTGPRCGGERNSARIRHEFRKEFVRQRVPASVKETQCICFGLCTYGPNVIVYPDGIVYSGVQPPDVAEIVRRHLLQGQVVERLLYKKKEEPAPSETDEPEGEPVNERPGS